jgi:hypothetical protein
MTIYQDSKRIVGTNADRIGTPAVLGGWKELDRTTLGSAGDTISVSSLTDKRYYMILGHIKNTGGDTVSHVRANSDSSGNYALRRSVNGGSDSTSAGTNRFMSTHDSKSIDSRFIQGYIANKSSQGKLGIFNVNENPSTGAGTAPSRIEGVGKHVQTSNPINELQLFNDEAGSFDTGGELVVLGYDPDDTHTDNFWEELASVDTGAGAVLDSGTFTAKKYLWFQFDAVVDTYNNTNATIRFNSDTGSNYNRRLSQNGMATDNIAVNQSNMTFTYSGGKRVFGNYFVINNSANEKLAIGHTNAIGTASNSTSEGAGVAPRRVEVVGKWANTSSQITQIEVLDTAQGDLGLTSGTIKVWGSN